MFEGIPIWIIVIDYAMGLVMWTLVGRFGMSLFVSEHSDFFFMKAFMKGRIHEWAAGGAGSRERTRMKMNE